MEDRRGATWGEPGGTSRAVGVAIVEGRAIRPDVLPVSWHSAWPGDGDRRGGSIFQEKAGVSSMIPEAVRPSKEGLW